MEGNKATILIADDEERIRRMLKDFLASCGYSIIEAADGKQALELFYSNSSSVNLILLDVMMPHIDGFEVLKEIRETSLVPIIMLTAKSQEYDQLSGLKSGADDYVSKPFSPSLLAARIENILRRCNAVHSKVINIGQIEINDVKREVKVRGEAIELTSKEYALLLYLIENKDIALSRENILNAVWNYDYYGDLRTVDTHIKQLRAKLTAECDYIKTVRGLGYRFEV